MKFFLASVIALGLAASTAFAQLTVNTPPQQSVVECEPLQITWSGGTEPYYLSIVPGGDPTGAAILTLGTFAGNSASWLVNLPQGTSIVFNLKDNTGATSQSAPVSVQPSTTSCNTSSLSVSPSTGAAPATGSSGSTPTGSSNNSPATLTTASTPNTGTGTGTGVSTSGPAKTGASSSSTSSTSTKSAGASRVTGQIAAAGIIGAAMVALLG